MQLTASASVQSVHQEDIALIPGGSHNYTVTQWNDSKLHMCVLNAVNTWDTEQRFLHAVESDDALFFKYFLLGTSGKKS